MEFIYALLVIILASFSIFLLSNFKALESIFIFINSSIVFLLILTYIGNFTIAAITLCVLIGILSIGAITYSITKKQLITKIKSFIKSPALIILIVCTLGFCVVSRGAQIVGHDDFNFWALAPKLLLEYNGFNQPLFLKSNAHPNGLPIYYAITSFFAGSSFDVMLVSKWFLVWVYLLLPFANHDFKNYKIVLLYSIIVYSIMLTINHSIIELYSDIVIYTISASTVAYYYLQKDKKKCYVIVFSAILLMPYIKEYFSIILTIFLLLIFVFDILYTSKCKLKKSDYVFLISSGVTFVFSFLLNKWIRKAVLVTSIYKHKMKSIDDTTFVDKSCFNELTDSLTKTMTSPIGIILCSLILISIVTCFILLIKNSKYTYISFLPVVILPLILSYFIYMNLSDTVTKLIIILVDYIKNLEYINIGFINIFTLIIIIAIAYYIFMIKDSKKRKYFIALCIILATMLVTVLSSVIINRSMLQNFVVTRFTPGIVRYIGTSIYFLVFLTLMYLIGNTKMIMLLSKRVKCFLISSIIVFIVFNIMPMPLTIYNEKTNNYTSNVKFFAKYSIANQALEYNVNENENICIIINTNEDDDRPGYIAMLFRYYALVPSYKIIRLDPDLDISDQEENLFNYINKNEISKVYYFNDDEKLDEAFVGLFQNPSEIQQHQLYSVIWQNDIMKLMLIE